MNRGRRTGHKPFVIGGVYNASSCPHTPQSIQLQNNLEKGPIQELQTAKVKPKIQPTPQLQFKQKKLKQQEQQLMKQEQQQIQQQQQQQQQQQVQCSQKIIEPIGNPNSVANNPQSASSNDTATPMEVEKETCKEGIEPHLDRKTFFSKIFAYRKKSSLRAKEKKIRQNRNLRKVILPKNALMALNEVKGVQIGDFIVDSISVTGGFSALVTVNNVQYEGRGVSKATAKNNACEKALRDFVIAKMQQKPRRISTQSLEETAPMDTADSTAGNENTEANSSNRDKDTLSNEDSDVPMVNLASFALYKLFSEWESEGYHIPEFHNGSSIVQTSEKANITPEKLSKKVTNRSELPNNWQTLHPATLLCMMRPGLTYCNWITEGERPNIIQSISVTVDDLLFVGKGRSKKIARKNAAIAACNQLFGTNFIKEE